MDRNLGLLESKAHKVRKTNERFCLYWWALCDLDRDWDRGLDPTSPVSFVKALGRIMAVALLLRLNRLKRLLFVAHTKIRSGHAFPAAARGGTVCSRRSPKERSPSVTDGTDDPCRRRALKSTATSHSRAFEQTLQHFWIDRS